MHFFWLIVGILGVWRVTHLLHAEDGPWDVVVGLRRRAGSGFWGRLLDCFYCLSLWVAAPFAWSLGDDARMMILLWPALSGAAILLERSTSQQVTAPALYWKEDDTNAVLREEPISRGRDDTLGS